jgi:hypothetical protein
MCVGVWVSDCDIQIKVIRIRLGIPKEPIIELPTRELRVKVEDFGEGINEDWACDVAAVAGDVVVVREGVEHGARAAGVARPGGFPVTRVEKVVETVEVEVGADVDVGRGKTGEREY